MIVLVVMARRENVLELYIDDMAYVAETALQVFFTRVLRESPDIDLVRLQQTSVNTPFPMKEIPSRERQARRWYRTEERR